MFNNTLRPNFVPLPVMRCYAAMSANGRHIVAAVMSLKAIRIYLSGLLEIFPMLGKFSDLGTTDRRLSTSGVGFS